MDSVPKNALKKLMEAFYKRFHRIIEVIDDALNSEQLRDRIWAVEQMLKRVKPESHSETGTKKRPTPKALSQFSDDELLKEIQSLITPKSNRKNTHDSEH